MIEKLDIPEWQEKFSTDHLHKINEIIDWINSANQDIIWCIERLRDVCKELDSQETDTSSSGLRSESCSGTEGSNPLVSRPDVCNHATAGIYAGFQVCKNCNMQELLVCRGCDLCKKCGKVKE